MVSIKKAVDLLFAHLREAFAKHKFEANVVYNIDKSGITTVQNVPKVIGWDKLRLKSVDSIASICYGIFNVVCEFG